MEAIYRITESLDWISILIFSCVLSVAIARQFTTMPLIEFLSIYTSSRFIKISIDSRIENYHTYQYLGLIIYSITISLICLKLYSLEHNAINFKDFILIWTAVSSFLVFRHYLLKLVSTIANFEEMITIIDHSRNLYRAVLSMVLIIAVLLIYYVFPSFKVAVWTISIIALIIVFTYHLLLTYSHRNLIFPSIFYFILYLCTLEIAPYLLLYKYFTV